MRTTLRIRYVADRLSYNTYNPINDVLRLGQNIALVENGTCTGDSGDPIFNADGPLGRVQVALVSGGDKVCRATTAGPGLVLRLLDNRVSDAPSLTVSASQLAGLVTIA